MSKVLLSLLISLACCIGAKCEPINSPPTFSMGENGVTVWGGGIYGALAAKIPLGLDLTKVRKVYSGTSYGMALTDVGSVKGWGAIERHNGIRRVIEEIPDGLEGVKYLDLNKFFVMGVLENGKVISWGAVPEGLKAFLNRLENVKMVDYSEVPDRCLVLFNDGTLKLFGDDHVLSRFKLNIPNDLKNVQSISCGYLTDMALKDDGTVVAWGGKHKEVPPDITKGLKDAIAVSVAHGKAIVLFKDGTVFEHSHYGGRGHTTLNTDIYNNMKFVQVGPIYNQNIGLTADGIPVVWGLNMSNYPAPVPKWLHGVFSVSVGRSAHNLAAGPTQYLRVKNDGKFKEFRGFAFDISPGSEDESHQAVRFEVQCERPDMFKILPSIDEEGTLTFQAKEYGHSDLKVVAVDDGPEVNGLNRSQPRVVTLFVVEDEFDPSAIPDEYEVKQDHRLHVDVAEGVLMNDLSKTPTQMEAVVVKQPTYGKVIFRKHGDFCYTPMSGFIGEDVFIYQFKDSVGRSNDAKVKIVVVRPGPIPKLELKLKTVYHRLGDDWVYEFKIPRGFKYYKQRSFDPNGPWVRKSNFFHSNTKKPIEVYLKFHEHPALFIRGELDYYRGPPCRSE